MKAQRLPRRDMTHATAEPVGIVISRGRDPEALPRFAAYVYAPDPGATELPEAALAIA